MKFTIGVFNVLRFKKTISALLLVCAVLAGCSEENSHPAQTEQKNDFAKLEDKFDAKLGVYALDTGTNQTVTYRPNKRFIHASTHKALTAGALLQQKSLQDLNKKITFTQDDLVNYNPITEKHVDSGMTLEELCEASLRYSDNTAENLILKQIGGPAGLKKTLRQIGDKVTNPERFEPELNEVKPGETRDTSTPKALATSLQAFTIGDTLPKEKRAILTDWLKGNATGDTLIRAGVPKGWEVADKSGSGSYGTRNDIAIIWPPKKDPIVLAVLTSRDKKDADTDDKLIELATKQVMHTLKDNSK